MARPDEMTMDMDEDGGSELEAMLPQLKALIAAGKIDQAKKLLHTAGVSGADAQALVESLQDELKEAGRKLPGPTSKDPNTYSQGSLSQDNPDDPSVASRSQQPPIGQPSALRDARQGEPQSTDQGVEDSERPDLSAAQVAAGVKALKAAQGQRLSDVARQCFLAMQNAADGKAGQRDRMRERGGSPGESAPTSMPPGQNPTSY